MDVPTLIGIPILLGAVVRFLILAVKLAVRLTESVVRLIES
jgi:hypothetical protein